MTTVPQAFEVAPAMTYTPCEDSSGGRPCAGCFNNPYMLIMSINGERSMTRLQEGVFPRARKKQAVLTPSLLPDLAYTPEVARETAYLYERVSRVIPPIEWPGFAPYVKAINELKRARNAVVLAHNYMTPEIFHCVADVVGD